MMLRLYRKTIFPRWSVNRKTPSEKRNPKLSKKAFALCTASQNHKHSNQNDQKKQHANKHDKRHWDDPHFQFNFIQTSMLETAGWLGTAALYFSYHLKQIHSIFEHDKAKSCIFSKIVLAMPRHSSKKKNYDAKIPDSFSQSSNLYKQTEKKTACDNDILESFRTLTDQYISAMQNSAGMKAIDKNDRKAFRYFQSAARHGSIEGFYNLGLCYHLGKGTKVNLNMAAFCYRKAAMKGHGLASFNLAVFFHKGLGGLPIDPKIAKELLSVAAEKGIPEAQLYFGIEFLEEKRWQEAVHIFTSLAEKNVSDAQYYLGLCYESGLGVEKSKEKAQELFTKSASQGNKRAIVKVQTHQENEDLNYLFKSAITKNKEQNKHLHISSSVPELSAIVKKTVQSTTTITISSYLDLIPPFFVARNSDVRSENNFFIGENNPVREYSNTLLSFKSIPLVMQVKKITS